MKDFIDENLKLIIGFRGTLTDETDRGCALMAASYLENELEKLLRFKLVGTQKQLEDLFSFNGPMGTFSSKIKMSYSLGVISLKIMKDLEIIRKIRNEFGHDFNPINFETEQIRNRIFNLNNHYLDPTKDEPRRIFTNSTLGVLAQIHAELIDGEKISEKQSEEIEQTNEFSREVYQAVWTSIEPILLANPEMSKEEIEKLMFNEFMKIARD